MKSTKLLIFSLLLAISSSGFAQKINATCKPSVVNNYVPCDVGYSGKKYKTTTVSCTTEWPSGVVSTTPTFNTSQCVKIPDLPTVDRTCELTPAACAPQPRSPGCPAGKHWTLTGSAVAHCVDNDSTCPRGTSLTHDARGNPSCVANTCTSNQVLQSDGMSCACPAGTVWNGGNCVPLPPPCTPSVTKGGNVACDVGYTGFKQLVTTTTCPGNKTSSYWDTSACVPAPRCTNGWTNYPICGPVSPPPPPAVEHCPNVKKIPTLPGAYPYLYYKPAGEVKMVCAYGPNYTDSSGTGFKDLYDASIAQGFKCDPFVVRDAFGAGTGWEIYWTCEAR